MSFIESGESSFREVARLGYATIIHGGGVPGGLETDLAIAKDSAFLDLLQAVNAPVEISAPDNELYTLVPTTAESISLQAAWKMEEIDIFNAGRGAKLQADGVARVSAGFMESNRQKLSSVVNAEGILHPSQLAYQLQARKFSMLDRQGASDLADELGIPRENLTTSETLRQWQAQSDQQLEARLGRGTVGAVSVDADGNIAVVTSTGGVGFETPGRIGDSPTAAGTYCTDDVGVSCTGIGEQIVDLALAPRIAVRAEDGMALDEAMTRSIDEAVGRGYTLCAIALQVDRSEKVIRWIAGSTEFNFAWARKDHYGVTTFKYY